FSDLEELVVGAAAGVRGCDGRKRATGGDHALAPAQRVLVQLRRRQIAMDALFGRYTHGYLVVRAWRRCSNASTAAITAMFTMSGTSDNLCKTWTGRSIPTRIGPIACASPSRASSL